MKITWYGNASVLLEAEGEQILFDPFVELKGGEHRLSASEFAKYPNVCITHGHLDHLASLPEILGEARPNVWCTEQAEKNLSRFVGELPTVRRISPGDCFFVGKVKLTVFRGRHIRYDKKLVLKKAFSPRTFRYFSNLLYIGRTVRKFPENGETVVYLAEGEGKRALVMGSLGLDDKTQYPEGVDAFVCPFQGSTRIEELAEGIITRLRPKTVILDHFDDAFPPLSDTIDTSRFCAEMSERHKEIKILTPAFGESIEL